MRNLHIQAIIICFVFFLRSFAAFQNPELYDEYRYFFPETTGDLYIECFSKNALSGLNVSGRFSDPEREVYSLTGGSFRWTRYFLGGIDITDNFFSGASLHKPPVRGVYPVLNTTMHRITYASPDSSMQGLFFFGCYDPLWGRYPLAGLHLHRILNPYGAHALDRDQGIADYRRSLRRSGGMEYAETFSGVGAGIGSGAGGDLFLKIHSSGGARDFVRFDGAGSAWGYLTEDFFRQNIGLLFLPYIPQGFGQLRFSLYYSYLWREHLYAGEYYHHQLCPSFDMHAISAGAEQKKKTINRTIGLNYSHKYIGGNFVQSDSANTSVDPIHINLADQDGEGNDIPALSAHIHDSAINAASEIGLNIPWFSSSMVKAEARAAFVRYTPEITSFRLPMYYADGVQREALYVLDITSSPFSYHIIDGTIKAAGAGRASRMVYISGEAGLTLNGLFINHETKQRGVTILLPDMVFKTEIGTMNTKYSSLKLAFGRTVIPFTPDAALFLSRGYQSGAYYHWRDDGDLVFEDTEHTGVLYRTTGGEWHSYADDLKMPYYYYLNIPLTVTPVPRLTFGFDGEYKSFRRLFTVRHKGGDSAYMYRTDTGYEPYLVYDYSGVPVYYELANLPGGYLADYGLKGDGLTTHPFYAGAVVHAAWRGRIFFSEISFNAFMAVGPAAGNGHLENSFGTISEKSANPNSRYLGIGRMDPDRGYMGKWLMGWKITDMFRLSAAIKYRDGQPVSHYNAVFLGSAEKRRMAELSTVTRGDNIYNKDFGEREDALWGLDVFVNWDVRIGRRTLAVTFSVYNTLDVGGELAEKIYRNGRRPLELQNPRGFQITVGMR